MVQIEDPVTIVQVVAERVIAPLGRDGEGVGVGIGVVAGVGGACGGRGVGDGVGSGLGRGKGVGSGDGLEGVVPTSIQ